MRIYIACRVTYNQYGEYDNEGSVDIGFVSTSKEEINSFINSNCCYSIYESIFTPKKYHLQKSNEEIAAYIVCRTKPNEYPPFEREVEIAFITSSKEKVDYFVKTNPQYDIKNVLIKQK